MTKVQAAEVHVNWHQQGEPPICEHLKVELECSHDGHLTGSYYCLACGDSVARDHRTSTLSSSAVSRYPNQTGPGKTDEGRCVR